MQPITLYHCKAEDLLPTIEPESAAVIHFDGPYGMSYRSNHRGGDRLDPIEGDFDPHEAMILHSKIYHSAHNILTPGGSLFIWTSLTRPSAWHTMSFLQRDLNSLKPPPMQLFNKITWDKLVFGTGWNWRTQTEEVLCFFRSFEDVDVGAKDVSPSMQSAKSVVNKSVTSEPSVISVAEISSRLRWFGDKNLSNIISCPRVKIPADGHPAEKPVPVIAHLLKPVTRHGDLVIDPACGSGAAVETAYRLGCRVIACDIKKKWITHTYNRLKKIGAHVTIKELATE